MTFYRAAHTTLWLTIQSNESLGVLDSDYIEDYHGADGQLTLHHVATTTDYPVLMAPQPDQTPLIPNDVFRGPVTLATLPDGDYELRGRVRDVTGNYTILSAFASPQGGEDVQAIVLTILPGNGYQLLFSEGATLTTAVVAAEPFNVPVFAPGSAGGDLIRDEI